MDEFQGIMDALLPTIKNKLSYTQSIFDLWFADLKLLELTESHSHFLTSTNLRKKILSTKYNEVIRQSLAEVIGFEVDISVESENKDEEFGHSFSPESKEPIREAGIRDEKEQRELIDFINDTSKKSLIEEYTFDNFIEGESNKFARAACLAVAKEPTTYNPLFIYGHSGLGKTHLLYAVINYIKKNHPSLKIVYKKCEDFINELIMSISTGKAAEFKENYRTADVLLIDDVQFIAGKVSTQEEFFHTFSTLYEADKQIILTSDRPPNEIKPLEDRLRTRFEGGLIADVQPPSFELRTAIIRKKCDSMNLNVSQEHIHYMAERLQNNIRQIEGVLKRLHAFCSLTTSEITKEKIDEFISIVDPGNIPNSVLIERILNAVSKKYGVSAEDIKSKKKTENIASARHVAIYIIRKETELSLKEIGRLFNRDHTTIMASINKVDINLKTVKNAQSDMITLIKEIKG